MKRALMLAVAGATAVGMLPPGHAAAPKRRPPISKMYLAYADRPDPTNAFHDVAGTKPAPDRFPYTVCEGTVEGSRHVHTLAVQGPGRLVVDLELFQGDWDLMLTDANGRQISAPTEGNKGPNDPTTMSNEGAEHVSYRAPRAMTIKIVACNRISPSTWARVRFTYTYR